MECWPITLLKVRLLYPWLFVLPRHYNFQPYCFAVSVEYFPESLRTYKGRRLTVAIALIYLWLFVGLLIFWVFRIVTGQYSRLTVPPFGSGIIHLLLCFSVVLAYVLGSTCVPRHATVGMRGGSLPSLVGGRGVWGRNGAPRVYRDLAMHGNSSLLRPRSCPWCCVRATASS